MTDILVHFLRDGALRSTCGWAALAPYLLTIFGQKSAPGARSSPDPATRAYQRALDFGVRRSVS